MENNLTAEQFATIVCRALVSFPEDVSVEKKTDEMGVLLTVRVNKDEWGKVIGKGGSTAKAIRTLARIIGIGQNQRINMRFDAPSKDERSQEGY